MPTGTERSASDPITARFARQAKFRIFDFDELSCVEMRRKSKSALPHGDILNLHWQKYGYLRNF